MGKLKRINNLPKGVGNGKMRHLIQFLIPVYINTLSPGALCWGGKSGKEQKSLHRGGVPNPTVLLHLICSFALIGPPLLLRSPGAMQPRGHKSMSNGYFFFGLMAARPLYAENSQARLGRLKPTQICMAHPPFARIPSSFTGQDVSIHLFGFFSN